MGFKSGECIGVEGKEIPQGSAHDVVFCHFTGSNHRHETRQIWKDANDLQLKMKLVKTDSNFVSGPFEFQQNTYHDIADASLKNTL